MKDQFQLESFLPLVRETNVRQRRRQQAACNRRKRQRERRELLVKFGGVCAHCGFSDERALQIDHINGGGSAERRSFNDPWDYYLYLRELGTTADYQVLCANCNAIKRIKNNEHYYGE